jgi:Third Longin domain of FUZ, MON1 and HPS1
VEVLRKNRCLDAIKKSTDIGDPCLRGSHNPNLLIPELRHFIYKKKKLLQIFCSEICEPYVNAERFERLVNLYFGVHHRMHNMSRPIEKLIENNGKEAIFVKVSVYKRRLCK